LGYSFYFTQVIDAGNVAAENPVPIEAAVGCAPETLFQVTAVKGQDESGRLQRCRNIGNVVDFSVNQADLIPVRPPSPEYEKALSTPRVTL